MTKPLWEQVSVLNPHKEASPVIETERMFVEWINFNSLISVGNKNLKWHRWESQKSSCWDSSLDSDSSFSSIGKGIEALLSFLKEFITLKDLFLTLQLTDITQVHFTNKVKALLEENIPVSTSDSFFHIHVSKCSGTQFSLIT